MDSFLTFFESMPSWQKLLWIIGCMSFHLLLEGVRPFFTGGYRTWRHTRTNLVFLGTTMAINAAFGILTVGVFAWNAKTQLGILHWIEWGTALELLLTVVIFDFIAQYCLHWCLHKVPFLWRLHMVHHSDTHVDVTTGTRHHPVDFVVRELFAVAAMVITGAPLAFYVFYRILTIFFTYLTHANLAMPAGLNRVLGWVIVTPQMHKFHHHFEAPWTDRNYGNMLSIWDRLLGTMVDGDPREIIYGLDVADDTKSNDLAYQLGLPFQDHRQKQKT
jgi:sterol desaturase/sphingolipid hydroxylase (fatty acid hydroxylase superfamily)